MMRRVAFVALVLLSWTGLASGAIITDYTGTTGAFDAGGFYGQAVSTGSGGPWDHITFSFLTEPGISFPPPEAPFASGTIFLLTQEYFGAPQDLSSSTPGFLAESTGVGNGAWDFASSVTLQPNTNYWFYTSTFQAKHTFAASAYPGGVLSEPEYFSSSVNSDFSGPVNITIDFRLFGDPTPEPSSIVLLGMGITGLGIARWRKRNQAA